VFFVWAQAAGLQCSSYYCAALFLGIKALQRAYIKTNTATGAAPRGGLRGTVPPLLTKVICVNRLKPMRKYWGMGERTLPTTLEFQPPEFVTNGF